MQIARVVLCLHGKLVCSTISIHHAVLGICDTTDLNREDFTEGE